MGRVREFFENPLLCGVFSTAARNPFSVLARWLGLPVSIRMLNDFVIPGTRVSKTAAMGLVRLCYLGAELGAMSARDGITWGVSFDTGEISVPSGVRFALESLDPVIFAETYIWDVHYAGKDLTGMVVVDVGAFVGDTALYYANRGAKVLAFEPDPLNYRLLERNLSLNQLIAPRIRAFNAAVGRHGSIRFSAGNGGTSGAYVQGNHQIEVPSYSLSDILGELPEGNEYLLKADCKGCEFDIAAQPELTRFDRIVLEYSADLRHESLEGLLGLLSRAGFEVERIFKHNSLFFSLRNHGVVCAYRRAGAGGEPARPVLAHQ